MGYSQHELEVIQERWNLRFPSDLVDLLRERRPLLDGPGAFDWLLSDPVDIQGRFDWPFEGFCFDIEHNEVWWPEWGPKPEGLGEQFERLREVFAGVPTLIPLSGHRYLPADPFEPGNPVFSVYQTDIICYGANLQDWIKHEREGWSDDGLPIKEIRFWSEAIRKNNAPP
ncbi:MAG TPA: hypothetical protein VJ890_04305 [Vineibacter sp.]|nr:hypothetical protein [Vineibacter sp.]